MLRIALDEIDSTNSEAQRRIAAGEIAGWTLVTSARQTAGRGRLGRSWQSPAGNFHGSFIVPREGHPEWRRPWLLGVVAALAVAETVAGLVEDGADVRIKWPNDVTLAGAKVAGLLAEGTGTNPFVVVGIGLNVAWSPEGMPYPTTALDRHRARPAGIELVTERLAGNLSRHVESWLARGFPPLRLAYLARTHRVGEVLSLRTGETRVSGRFLDIDEDGFLLIELDGKVQRVTAGDVLGPP